MLSLLLVNVINQVGAENFGTCTQWKILTRSMELEFCFPARQRNLSADWLRVSRIS